MHKSQIRKDAMERILQRRGKAHYHDHIELARTALIVIDMQNAFVAPGYVSEVPIARDIVPNINRLAAEVRRGGGTVVWIQSAFTPAVLNEWSSFFGSVYSRERSEKVIAALTAGTEGHKIWPKLEPKPGDMYVTKNRFSCFIQGSSDLEARLRQIGVDTVMITGTLTNVCCESTARDANMRNFKVVFLTDGNAATTDEDHNASLTAVAQTFGDVMSTDEAIAKLVPVAKAKTGS